MKNIRRLAVESLLKVNTQNAWSNLVTDNMLKKHKPDSRDAAFFTALFYGVLERGVTLDACIAAHSKMPLDKLSPVVLEILRTGVYQLLYMDSVPDHAAVGESAEVARNMGKPQAVGFVNGVLRSFLRAGKAVPIPEAPLELRLSVEYSCPAPVVAMWLESYGEELTLKALGATLGRAPLYVRVNTLLITAEELISRLSAHDVIAVKDKSLENCLLLEKAGAINELPEFKRGFFHVQDKASQLASASLQAGDNERVLDVCAAPGGKTFTIAELMRDSGEIVACDLYGARADLLKRRAKAMGFKSIKAEARDMTVYDESLGSFDKILCDAPCSGLGAIRRKPEIKRNFNGQMQGLPELQYKILETASKYCKDGGRVIYSTCTLNPAENEKVVERFLAAHPEFTPAALPEILGGGSTKTFLGDMDADGFFIAAMTKTA